MAVITCSGTVVHHKAGVNQTLESLNTLVHLGKVRTVTFFNPMTKSRNIDLRNNPLPGGGA